MRSADYLAFYAEHFHTVEVDSTFYGCPTARTVNNWGARTPEGFIFSVKVPQVITHEKVLADCDADLKEFLDTMSVLGPKLGPIVFQFPFFSRSVFRDRHEFLDRLVPFLAKLPNSHKFAIEMRNRDWLDAEFANLLRDHRIAFVLQDRSFMPSPAELKFDDFCYQMRKRGVIVFAYANNHFGGHAPATIKQFQQLWQAKGLPELSNPQKAKQENSLFPD